MIINRGSDCLCLNSPSALLFFIVFIIFFPLFINLCISKFLWWNFWRYFHFLNFFHFHCSIWLSTTIKWVNINFFHTGIPYLGIAVSAVNHMFCQTLIFCFFSWNNWIFVLLLSFQFSVALCWLLLRTQSLYYLLFVEYMESTVIPYTHIHII